jgi:DNA-binding NtrC family response regulator
MPTTKRILLVDDEDVLRESLAQVLTKAGYEVIARSGGRAALTVIRENASIDLLVTDLRMPEVSGSAVAEAFALAQPRSPVVVMSGFMDDGTIQERVASGAYTFMQKPFRAARLLEKVIQLIGAPGTVST